MAIKATKSTATEKADKPKVKRQTATVLRKEIEGLKANNLQLLKEIGRMSELYLNAIADKDKDHSVDEKKVVVLAVKRIVAFLMQTYGLTTEDILK